MLQMIQILQQKMRLDLVHHTNRQVRLGNIQRSNNWTGYIKNVKIWNAPVDWATADSTPMS